MLRKAFQKRLYTFLSTQWGIALIILASFWCLNTFLQIIQLLVKTGPLMTPNCLQCCQHNYADNLLETSFEGRLCLPQVDIVYTWVNGSDPKLQRDVAHWKPLFMKENGFEDDEPAASQMLDVVAPNITHNGTCPGTHPFAYSGSNTDRGYCCQTVRDNSGHVLVPSSDSCHDRQYAVCPAPPCGDHNFEYCPVSHPFAYSGNHTARGFCCRVPRDQDSHPLRLNSDSCLRRQYVPCANSSCATNPAANWSMSLEIEGGGVVKTTDDKDFQAGQNRFRDNNELRYSLRSLWKFAPWVRHVYIVTNGQVPHWVNMDHPRITVVGHDEIFVNKSHLPTFASPSIETHLHRVPGVADKFIYFNDDVMLGNTIWPDDFYTHAHGQKIYLSWNVPSCADGCADSWLADKFCDQACNTSACLWDGGDCLAGANASTGSRYSSWSSSDTSSYSSYTSSSSSSRYCSSGCPNNWVGDKVCDRSCKNAECAFDGGDCGLELIEQHITGFNLTTTTQDILLAPGAITFYINLRQLFPGTINEASHDSSNLVRSAIVTQNLHILAVILFPQETPTTSPPPPSPTALPGNYSSHNGTGTTSADSTTTVAPPHPPTQTPQETSPLAPEIMNFYIKGTHNDVVTEVMFNVTRPFPSASSITSTTGNSSSSPAPTEVQSGQTAGLIAGLHGDIGLASLHTRRLLTSAHDQLEDDNKDNDHSSDVSISTPTPEESSISTSPPVKVAIAIVPDSKASLALSLSLSLPNPFKVAEEEANSLGRDIASELITQATEWIWKPAEELMNDIHVEGVAAKPSGDDMVMRGGEHWSAQDEELALWIENTKQKQIVQLQKDLAKELFDKMTQVKAAEREEAGSTEPVWPWEVAGVVAEQMANTVKKHKEETEEERQEGARKAGARRLLAMDTFADSLRFVNSLFTMEFGRDTRKVPAHMPHFIDKNVMTDLQARWPEQYDQTSSHRFRHPRDMQFSLSYFYYYMHVKQHFKVEEFFTMVDSDGSGEWERPEVEYVALVLAKGNEITEVDTDRLYNKLRNASLAWGVPDGKITLDAVIECPSVLAELTAIYERKNRYKHEMMELNEVDFYMVGSNYTQVQKRLNELRAKGPKFICLNDDMNKTHDPDPRLLKALHDFYTGYFPRPCPFELPNGTINKYLYLEQYRAEKAENDTFRRRCFMFVTAVLVIPVCLWCLVPLHIRRELLRFSQSCPRTKTRAS